MRCVNCGHEQAAGIFCDNCGMRATRIRPREPEPVAGGGAEQAPAELRCRCGHVQRGGRFCEACGVMLDYYRALPDREVAGARCPQCGGFCTQPLCRNCGVRLPDFPGAEEA